MAPPFLHLRVRTPYSLAEGALGAGKLVKLCQQYGMPAVGVTDSNNLFGALEFAMTAAKSGIQPVIGCALHLEPTAPVTTRPGHPVPPEVLYLYAQNDTGYRNLLHLVSETYLHPASDTDSPRIKASSLQGYTSGLLACTGTPDTALGRLLLRDKPEPVRQHLDTLQTLFDGRLYLGLARHGLPDELAVETPLVTLAHEQNIPLLAVNDVYFADADFVPAHEALLCIAAGTTLSATDRRLSHPAYAFRSPDEIATLFADVPEALANTLVLAKRCAVMPEVQKPILPRYAQGESEEDALRRMAKEGLEKRLALLPADTNATPYQQRLEYELDVIIQMGFPGYFLIVADFIQWAKANDIPVGPGRGSGAGSVVAWALTITDLDPLRWGLLFERFLNPERVSMPDFDIDFCQDRRDEVIGYVQEKYGRERVAQIITFGKLQARAALRDVGRVLEMPYGQVDSICKLVPNNPANPVTLEEAVNSEPQLQEYRKNEETSRLIEIGLQLEGLYRHASTHAAGVVIGDRPLRELVPLYQDPRSPLPATQFNMKYVEQAGLVKFDFLGLKTLTVMQKACALIKQQTGRDINLETLPLDDPATYELLGKGESTSVFQLESSGMRDVLRKMKPDRFEDIIALVALYRPGPMDNIPRYIACKHGEEKPDYLHPMLEGILKETFGVIIYQEQVMQIAQVMGGYSLGAADLLRRAMGKKIKEEMDAQAALFMEGAKASGVGGTVARNIFEQVAKFAGYGFNKSHAAAYALVAYQTAWLKANYPVEFMAATMTYDMQNTDKLAMFRQELQRLDIPVLSPDINASFPEFTVETTEGGQKAVRYALAAIKGVGDTAIAPMITERDTNERFTTVFQLASRVGKALNKRILESLIGAGALDSLHPCRASLYAACESILGYAASCAEAKVSAQESLFALVDEPSTSGKAAGEPDLPKAVAWSPLEQLAREHQALGFYLSAHPLDSYQAVLEQQKVTPSSQLAEIIASKGSGRVTLAGVMVAKKERRSAKGNKYAFVQFSDTSGIFEVTFFSETLSEAKAALDSGSPLLIMADASADGEGFRLTAQGVRLLETLAASNTMGLEMTISTPAAIEALRTLLLPEPPGSAIVRLHLKPDTPGFPAVITMDLPKRYRLGEATRHKLKGLQGVTGVRDIHGATKGNLQQAG